MRKYAPSLMGIEGDLAFSKNTVWLYVKLPALPYEFIDYNSREGLARDLVIGISNVLQSKEKEVECHLVVTNVPFDHKKWRRELEDVNRKNNPSPAWPAFLNDMQDHVMQENFQSREVYLGINIGKRQEYKNTGVGAAFRDVLDGLSLAFGSSDPYITSEELEFWDKKAEITRSSLFFGLLNAEKIKAESIARLLKETLWPDMPITKVSANDKQSWGEGEISGLAIADIKNNSKMLEIAQMENGNHYTGYRATLCFSRFPEEFHFPEMEPWIHYASTIEPVTTFYSRFTIEPVSKVQKQIERKIKEINDQIENITGGGGSPTDAQYDKLLEAQALKDHLEKERQPWIFARHRIIVTADSKEQLEKYARQVIDLYKSIDIDVVWPSGDQVRLLLEAQPGDTVRSSAYYQRQELSMLAVGMPNASGKVGDTIEYTSNGKKLGWLGPYLGRTNSRVSEPVFVSLHSAIAKNNPPGCVITGAPGGGKSFTGMSLAYMMALQGVWSVFIDPKGDALPMQYLPGLEGRIRVFDLRNGNEGLLDPFSMTPDASLQKLLAMEVVQLFLGSNLDPKTNNALIEAINITSKSRYPSLHGVVERLHESEIPEGQSLGKVLDLMSELPFARLCFAPNTGQAKSPMSPEDGLTIINLQSLDLPATSESERYTYPNRLAVGIMFLLANYTESLMNSTNKSHPKAVIIDEAWAITSTPQGANMIPRLARMGRSLNTALILISQNAGDFIGLTNNTPYRLCFGTKDSEEIENVSKFLGMESGEDKKALPGTIETISSLKRGQCIMRDPDGRITRVIVDNWNEEMFEAFNTNPESRKEYTGNSGK